MAVAPPSAESLTSNMLSTAIAQNSGLTDFNEGSVFRTGIEATAIEIEGIYAAQLEGTDRAIRDAIYSILSVPPALPTSATAILTFAISPAPSSGTTIVIPVGTLVAVPNSSIQFAVTAQGQLTNSVTSANLSATCQTPGTVGNVQASSLTQILSPLSVLQAGVTVTNSAAVTNGAAAPSQLQRAADAQRQLQELKRGTNNALEGGALKAQVLDTYGNVTEQVVKAQAVAGGTAGTATLYIYNGTSYSSTSGAGASSALITATENEINGYTDAQGNIHYGWAVSGQQVTVDAVTEAQQAVTVSILPQSGLTVSTLTSVVTNSITNFFNNLSIGDGVSVGLLLQAVLATAGVADAAITVPSASVAGTAGTLYFAGTITVGTLS